MAPGWWKKLKDGFNNFGRQVRNTFVDVGKKIKDTFTSPDFKEGFNTVIDGAHKYLGKIPLIGGAISAIPEI